MNKNMKKVVVPDLTSKLSFFALTRFLVSSSQESDRKKVQDILEHREKCLKDEMKLSKEILQKELEEEKTKLENVKKDCDDLIKEGDLKQKNLKAELEKSREEYEKKLTGLGELMNMKIDLASVEKKELKDEMRKQSEMYEKSLKEEMENLREFLKKKNELETTEICEVLKRELDSVKNKLSLASMEKEKLEDEMRRHRDLYEPRVAVSENSWRVELEKNCDLEKKLSQASVVKLQLEEELRMAHNLEVELRKNQMYLEKQINVLEVEKMDLNKKLEVYSENVCKMKDFAEQMIEICDSSISGNVRANGSSNNVSDAGDEPVFHSHGKDEIGCFNMRNEVEDGGCNENNSRGNCKRRRSARLL